MINKTIVANVMLNADAREQNDHFHKEKRFLKLINSLMYFMKNNL